MRFVYRAKSTRNVAGQYMKLLVADIMCHRPTYNVTVETLMADGRIFHRAVYPIKARDGEEAAAIVHNDLTLRMEPNFRISNVEEVPNE